MRQGCPASPSFFTVALAFISWSFRLTFGGLRLATHVLACLEYADDQILFTLTADGLQNMLDYIVATGEPFGLRLSAKKCELICFHRPGTVDKSTLPEVSVAGEILKWKSSVVYLGSCISEDGKTAPAIKHRICCAESVVTQQASFPKKICSGTFEGQVSRVSSICLAPVWARALCAWGPGQAAP